MPFTIVRNDITKMETDAIVNTANSKVAVGAGCECAIYEAAGRQELFTYRKEKIGEKKEGEVFVTPGFLLPAKYIIHAVSPVYNKDAESEEKLRRCYKNSLLIAKEYHLRSIAFPLISSGSFGWPRREAMGIALEEIRDFWGISDMMIYLVVFDEESTVLGKSIESGLKEYVDRHYVEEKVVTEYACAEQNRMPSVKNGRRLGIFRASKASATFRKECENMPRSMEIADDVPDAASFADEDKISEKLQERFKHRADTFSEYLLYLIAEKGLENSRVYNDALVSRKVFSKLKNNPDYHPDKLTALCLCIGARLNLDEAVDLLSRAGYAISPCDKTDIIFSYFLENGYYDMLELDIQLEQFGLPCIVS